MSNERLAGDMVGTLLAIYKTQLDEMKASGEVNVSLLKEVREFLKSHGIELDANEAPLQDLKDEHDEVTAWRQARSQSSS